VNGKKKESSLTSVLELQNKLRNAIWRAKPERFTLSACAHLVLIAGPSFHELAS
jgi:hypothetical protein